MATHSSILAWRIPWTEVWWVTVHAVVKDLDGGGWVTYKLRFQALSTSYIGPLDITSKT